MRRKNINRTILDCGIHLQNEIKSLRSENEKLRKAVHYATKGFEEIALATKLKSPLIINREIKSILEGKDE